jgi:uncharacterized protein (DUF58 family)
MWPYRERLRRWWLRRLPAAPVLRLGHKRIYLLPTRFGWLMLAVAGTVWVGALNYGVSLAYLLAFWLLALMLVSVLLAYRQLAGLQLSQLSTTPGFAGDYVGFSVLLEAPAGPPRRLQLRLFANEALTQEIELVPGQSLELSLACLAERRGRIAMPALEIASEVPFGLIRAFAWGRFLQSALAYPKPEADPSTQGKREARAGGVVARVTAGEEEFSHLAEYRPGESSRRVAWRASARREVLVSKRFAGSEQSGELRLDWADYAPQCSGEIRLARLAWRVLEAERAGLRYRLCLPGQEVRPGPRQQEEALAALALFGAVS